MDIGFQAVDTSRIQLLAILGSILLVGLIFELVRRERLRAEYSLIWFVCASLFLFFSIWRGAFDALAHKLGIAYSPALLILVILVFGFLILVHISVVMSRLTAVNHRLTQEVALLRERMERTESGNSNAREE